MTSECDKRWVPGEKRRRDRYLPEEENESEPLRVGSLRDWLLNQANEQRLEDHLDWYLRTDNGYDGRHFEWFVSQSSHDRFDAYHVLAAESLSIKVPPRAVRWLLERDPDSASLLNEIHELLRPGADTLWTCDRTLLTGERRHLASSGALFRLYYRLRTLGTNDLTKGGIGQVTTSKLLAAMFPEVVPIRDSMVEALLGLDDHENWWLTVRKLLEDDGQSLVRLLDGLRVPEGSEDVTTLRRLDIILWMEANARGLKPRSVRTTEYPGVEEEE